MGESTIRIDDGLEVPLAEVSFETSRSSGPGGQHVNKTESRVTLVFDLAASTTLDDDARRRIAEHCASRLSKSGQLRLSSQSHRSQKANRDEVIVRFAALLRDALAPVEERKPTTPSRAAKRRRVTEKRKHSQKKTLRKAPVGEE
jgi:ribosome-associated protein